MHTLNMIDPEIQNKQEIKQIQIPTINSQLMLCYHSDGNSVTQVHNNPKEISLIVTDEQEISLSLNNVHEFIKNNFQKSKTFTQLRDSNIYFNNYDASESNIIAYRSDIFAQGHDESKMDLWLLEESQTTLSLTGRSQLNQRMLDASMSLVATHGCAKADITLAEKSTLKIGAMGESEIYLNAQDSILDVSIDEKATLKKLKINGHTTVYNLSIKGNIDEFEGDWFNYIGKIDDIDPLNKRSDNPALLSVYNIAKASSELRSYDI